MRSLLDAPRASRSAGPLTRPDLRPQHLGVVIGLLVGAVIMLAVAALSDVAGADVPVLSSLAAAPVPNNLRPLAERTPPPPTAGICLSWKRPDALDADSVDCATSHLFEQAGPVQLADFAPGTPLPDNARFREMVNERCTPLVVKYLDGHYDPAGAFRAGALKPSDKSWTGGDRTLRCGLQRFSRSGALYPIVGKVAGQEQADIRPAGTCLGIDGKFVGDPVDCSLPHAEESVGFIDLGAKFGDKFPSPKDQDGYLQPSCTKQAANFAGGDDAVGSKRLVVIWNNLAQPSWAAGTRRVACNLAAVLPDKSGYAPIIGTVRGPVQVGSQPAPPARQLVAPGAPADGPGLGNGDGDDAGPAPPGARPAAPDLPSTPPSEQPSNRPALPALPSGLPTNPLGGAGGLTGGRPLGGGNN